MESTPAATAAAMALRAWPTARSPRLFCRLWKHGEIRDRFFELLSREDIGRVRQASSTLSSHITKHLFIRITVSFNASTFTKPSRAQALARIGHHIEHLTFNFPHSEATFLPPLVNPLDGHEVNFLYKPHTSMASIAARPKFATSELAGLLTQQYPPLFHAATNVPSFINALRHLVNMRHLTIRCPGQDPSERYRRDVVDYALISLRIAVERAPLTRLTRLTLTSLHPSAFNYLRHAPGFGSVPSATRRWRQIRKLHISVEAWDFYGASPGADHLKIMDDYIRSFAPTLEKVSFMWIGDRRGPCPLALSTDAVFGASQKTRGNTKLFNEITSTMSPLPACPPREAMHLPRLRGMQVRNANMNVAQLSALVAVHGRTVRQFEFENVALTDGGSWDDALAPLGGGWAGIKGDKAWVRGQNKENIPDAFVEVPSASMPKTWDDLDENDGRAASSAAVDAARGLSGVGLGIDQIVEEYADAYEHGGYDRVAIDPCVVGDDHDEFDYDGEPLFDQIVREDDEDGGVRMVDDKMHRQSTATVVSYSATLTRRSRHHKDKSTDNHKRPSDKSDYKHRRHGSTTSTTSSRDEPKRSRDFLPAIISSPLASLSHALSLKPAPLHLRHQRNKSSGSSRAPSPLAKPTGGTSRAPSPLSKLAGVSSRAPSPLSKAAAISASIAARIASPSPPPSLSHSVDSPHSLVHSTGCSTHPALRFEHLGPPNTPPPRPPPPKDPYTRLTDEVITLQPTVYSPPTRVLSPRVMNSPPPPDSGISPVYRNLELEETYRLMAEDADLRAGALKRAREAVLAKLSNEFYPQTREANGVYRHEWEGEGGVTLGGESCAMSFANGARFRDALFRGGVDAVVLDTPRLESTSTLVPLMLSR